MTILLDAEVNPLILRALDDGVRYMHEVPSVSGSSGT
jgi:hypothetical protein